MRIVPKREEMGFPHLQQLPFSRCARTVKYKHDALHSKEFKWLSFPCFTIKKIWTSCHWKVFVTVWLKKYPLFIRRICHLHQSLRPRVWSTAPHYDRVCIWSIQITTVIIGPRSSSRVWYNPRSQKVFPRDTIQVHDTRGNLAIKLSGSKRKWCLLSNKLPVRPACSATVRLAFEAHAISHLFLFISSLIDRKGN